MKTILTIIAALALTPFNLMAENTPAVGAEAPPVQLTSNDGKPVDLKEYKGKWVVLYFYPKDFTGGCTLEAQNFQRDLAQFEKENAVVLGVSVDDAKSHAGFCAKEGLHFKLLADVGGKVATEYGSVMDYQGTKMAQRNTFLINPAGKIAKVYTGVEPATHTGEVLADLAQLQKK
ncbi:MAG: peroxiredoxin [Verrucomicrobiota bacterium]|nr:peroxiredoxin [Verrucomicrobiota bacterium]